MPLDQCRECENVVSSEARRCPHCGARYPARPVWKGWGYEWKTQASLAGWPLVHIAIGRDARGRWRVARGIVAIGQFGIGLVTIAQFGVGALFGLGQVTVGLTGIGQAAACVYFAVGQLAVAGVAIGQLVIGRYGLGQAGYAQYLWSVEEKDPVAVEFFTALAGFLGL